MLNEPPDPVDTADQCQGYCERFVSIVPYISGFDQDAIRRYMFTSLLAARANSPRMHDTGQTSSLPGVWVTSEVNTYNRRKNT